MATTGTIYVSGSAKSEQPAGSTIATAPQTLTGDRVQSQSVTIAVPATNLGATEVAGYDGVLGASLATLVAAYVDDRTDKTQTAAQNVTYNFNVNQIAARDKYIQDANASVNVTGNLEWVVNLP